MSPTSYQAAPPRVRNTWRIIHIFFAWARVLLKFLLWRVWVSPKERFYFSVVSLGFDLKVDPILLRLRLALMFWFRSKGDFIFLWQVWVSTKGRPTFTAASPCIDTLVSFKRQFYFSMASLGFAQRRTLFYCGCALH